MSISSDQVNWGCKATQAVEYTALFTCSVLDLQWLVTPEVAGSNLAKTPKAVLFAKHHAV